MSTILAFGASGQLGQELAKRAQQRGIPISLAGREVDIAENVAVTRAVTEAAPAVVVNLAAYTKVDRAESEPETAFRANAVGPRVVAEACVAADIPLLHLSTDYVFDGNQSRPYVETDAIAPLCVYGRSKAEGEAAIRGVLECHLILRTSWVYGVYGMNFLKTILRLARERDELRVVSDQRGCPTASVDIADAILCIARLMATRKAVWGTYHFAGQSATTWHGFASEIVDAQAEFTHRRPLVVAISSAEHSTPARRPANSALDSSRFVATFGIRAENWHDRIRELTAVLLTGYSGNSRGWRSHPCSA